MAPLGSAAAARPALASVVRCRRGVPGAAAPRRTRRPLAAAEGVEGSHTTREDALPPRKAVLVEHAAHASPAPRAVPPKVEQTLLNPTVIAATLGVVSTVLGGAWKHRQSLRLKEVEDQQHREESERHAVEEAEEAERTLRVPLLHAAIDLQERCRVVCQRSLLAQLAQSDTREFLKHQDIGEQAVYVRDYTLYSIGAFVARAGALRSSNHNLASSDARSRRLHRLITNQISRVRHVMDEGKGPFRVAPGIALYMSEVMMTEGGDVMSFSAFTEQLRVGDGRMRSAFVRLNNDLHDAAAQGAADFDYSRLQRLQNEVLDLVALLDPHGHVLSLERRTKLEVVEVVEPVSAVSAPEEEEANDFSETDVVAETAEAVSSLVAEVQQDSLGEEEEKAAAEEEGDAEEEKASTAPAETSLDEVEAPWAKVP